MKGPDIALTQVTDAINDFSQHQQKKQHVDLRLVRRLTEAAIFARGEDEGFRALEQLSILCAERFSFDLVEKPAFKPNDSVISHIPGLIPKNVTELVWNKVYQMERNGWMSSNPDSVDGLPSLHLNLVTGGRQIFTKASCEGGDSCESFENGICDLIELISPFVYYELLPKVNELLNTTTIKVDDIFLRRYGDELTDGMSRNGISAHYDVFSRLTSVIALDDTAAQGTNGLYTTQQLIADTKTFGTTSNHAALRRFFPLQCGDGVVHTWDVLHGVHIDPGLNRTSLIVWFTDSDEPTQTNVPSWISKRSDLESNDVTQFVLASSLESASILSGELEQQCNNPVPRRSLEDATLPTTGASGDHLHYFDFYLESASRGNSFALTRLGRACEEGLLSSQGLHRAQEILTRLQPSMCLDLPGVPGLHELHSPMNLAKRFWLEGAVRGNAIAQIALGDECMMEASETGDSDVRLLAAVLFALAAQQPGNVHAFDSLARVIDFEVADEKIRNDEDFASSFIVRIAHSVQSTIG
jgi:hypothetical protein